MNLLHEEWSTIDIYGGPNSIGSLVKDIMVQLPDIVLHSRLHKERDPRDLVNQIRPIGFHRPPPAVTVGAWIIYIADIIDQDPTEQGANGLRDSGKGKLSGPLPPELKLHPDPMLLFRQIALCCLVVDPDHDLTLLAAVVDRNAGTAILEAFLNLTFPEFADKLLLPILVICVMEQLPNIQYPGMVIKSHVQTGNMESVILREQLKKPNKVTAAILLKSPAALAGHIQTDPHAGVAVIKDGDAPEIETIPVPIPPLLHGGPAHLLHAEQSYPIPRVLFFAANCKPIEQDHIFGDSVFHHFLPLLCR